MNNNQMDKIYLALELTKLYTNHTDKYTKEGIYDTFSYYINKLFNIEDVISVEDLQERIKNLSDENNYLRNEVDEIVYDKINTKLKCFEQILNDSKGDMEPYVYESLKSLL